MSNLFNKIVNGKQFNFQPFEFGTRSGYHVDVKDEEGTRWEFSMFHTNEKELAIEGNNLPAGKKAYALGFTLLDESKTLTDEEIDKTMDRLMKAFEQKLGAVIRK